MFAYADTGIPDGIQVDTEGRVYSGTGDGVQASASPTYSAAHFVHSVLIINTRKNRFGIPLAS